jgi:DNA invertase Pin-like site-specific DNA recombinase
MGTTTKAIGYTRVSTDAQGENGGGLAAQREAIERLASARGWQLVDVVEDVGVSGSVPLADRPAGARALARLRDGGADVLMVSKLDRLSRSAHDLAGLLEEKARRRRTRRRRGESSSWRLVSADLGELDMMTPVGELVANVLGAASRMERRMIGVRTSEALRAKQRAGLRLGRVPVMPDATRTLVLSLYRKHGGWSAVAHVLNERSVATASGGARWYPSTVRAVVLAATREVQPLRPTPRRRATATPACA